MPPLAHPSASASASALTLHTAPADFADWTGLLALLQASFAYMEGRIDPPSSLHRLDAAALADKARHETLLTATNAQGRLIGCAFADLRPEVVYVGKLAVDAAARGQGVARALCAAADTLARQHGRPHLELQTRVELVENQATFAALGFETVARTAHPGYDRITSLTMRRPVAPASSPAPGG
ncbi:GNAT family N-acetyltransferase [Ideonella livida]|uniref:GNAT family N-acetyltransferase n=1 Tax=Ideonella livida TaxID=2707176 RepID=A0A7C9PHQ1_9BURK|nr:GNAT family N-acetyltransferase [Ideonella livida]NDY92048.1 GNAT family N-acetyltransferase [Ideonella livida]